jgi:hypothetical protein
VPKGGLIWNADLSKPQTFARWDQVQDADQKLSTGGIQYDVLQPGGSYGNNLVEDPPPLPFVGELKFQVLSGSATVKWTLADPDTNAGERMLFLDGDGKQVTLAYMPLGRPSDQDPDLLAKVPAAALFDGRVHTLDVVVTRSEETLFVDGAQAADVAASPIAAQPNMEVAAFGNPGSVLITEVATYHVKG